MKDEVFNEDMIIRYLLGDLPEEEQVEIEDCAFRDQLYLKQVLAVESDLIDEYAQGGLTDSERRKFETRFLASEERRKKVKFALALASVAPEFAVTGKSSQSVTEPDPVTLQRARFASFREIGPAAKFLLAAAALLIFVGGLWLIVDRFRLRAQLLAEQQSRQEQQQALEQQLADERARSKDLTARLQNEQGQRERSEQLLNELERNQELKAQNQPTIVSLALIAGIPRSSDTRPKLTLRQFTRLARLQIEVEPRDDYSSFRVELRTQTGQQIWTRDNLSSRTLRGARAIFINLPASILRAGIYELALKGITDGGVSENVGYYYFDVLKK